jgi:hypothetical protein
MAEIARHLGGIHIGNSQGCEEFRISGQQVLIFNNVPISSACYVVWGLEDQNTRLSD